MVVAFKMIFSTRFVSAIVAITIILGVQVNAQGDTCSNIEPQPIGIDFGSSTVIAKYCHKIDNISTLAIVREGNYARHVFRIRLDNYVAPWLRKKRPETIFQLIAALWDVYITPRLSFLEYPTIKNLTILNYVRQVSSRIFNTAKEALFPGKEVKETLTLVTLKASFVSVLESVKATTLEDHNINITFAVLSVPDFFNSTLTDLLIEACHEVGIDTPTVALPRTIMSALGVDLASDSRILVIDQGEFYLGMRTCQSSESRANLQNIHPMYVPADHYGSRNINRMLDDRVIKGSIVLQAQLAKGADRAQLMAEISRARLLIKDNLDVNCMGKGMDEDHRHEEWPLELPKWWIGDEVGYNLSWADVQAAEDEYVEKLGELIVEFLVHCRRSKERSETVAEKEAKKRKLAPKRPLIPFFLFLETERPAITDYLGFNPAKGAVSAEGNRRWSNLTPAEKRLWTSRYTEKVRLYNARMHAFELGNIRAKDMSDQDAETYANENDIGVLPKIVAPSEIAADTEVETHEPEQIDTVVITTDYLDGPLLKRAVVNALGPDVEIIGGTTLSMFFAAEGAARSALKRHASWVEMRRNQGFETNVFGHDEF